MELYWGDEVVVWKRKLASVLETWPKVESSFSGNNVARSALRLAYSDSLVMSY